MAKAPTAEKPAATYSKEQLLRSIRYENRRDLVGALLKDGVKYSIKEVDDTLENFLKGKVK